MLICITDRPVLHRRFRVHHRSRFRTLAGPERRKRCSPPYPPLQDGQYHFRRRLSYSLTVAWSSTHGHLYPSYPARKSYRFSPLRFCCDVRTDTFSSTCVTELSQKRQRKPNEIVSWYFYHLMDGVATVDTVGRAVAPRLRPLPVPLGGRHHHFIGYPRCHLFWRPLLLLCRRRRSSLRKLPLSNSLPTQPPSSPRRTALYFTVSLCFRQRAPLLGCARQPVEWLQLGLDDHRLRPLFFSLGWPSTRNASGGRWSSLVVFARRVNVWMLSGAFASMRGPGVLNLDCISGVFQTSLDRVVHLSTLEYLTTAMELAECNPSLVLGCFNILISCVQVTTPMWRSSQDYWNTRNYLPRVFSIPFRIFRSLLWVLLIRITVHTEPTRGRLNRS